MRTLILFTVFSLFLTAPSYAGGSSVCNKARELAEKLEQLEGHEARLAEGKKWDPEEKLGEMKKGKGNKNQSFKCGGRKFIPDVDFKKFFWVKDTAGHAGCAWKIMKNMGDNQFSVFMCADENGKLISGKNESLSDKLIQCK